MIFALAGCSDSGNKSPVQTYRDRQVFICTSSASLRYHFSKSCPGLKKCKHTIVTTTLVAAQKRGRTRCGWE